MAPRPTDKGRGGRQPYKMTALQRQARAYQAKKQWAERKAKRLGAGLCK